MNKLLEINGLHVAYGKVEAVSNLTLQVPQKSIVTIIGPNGAGKSTSLNAMMGLLPYRGSVTFAGEPIDQLDTEDRVALGMCLVPERRELFTAMSVEDNLLLGAYVRFRRRDPGIRRNLDDVFERFPRLRERRTQLAGTLSGGERQMLALARALMAKPALIMLDEPSLGLAPRITRDIFRIIAELRSTGAAILLIEQNARAALHVADYAYVLEMGAITAQGPSAELAKDPRVIESYLGIGGASYKRPSRTQTAPPA